MNGDLSADRVQHYCCGSCCIDPATGTTTRRQQVVNVHAAISGAGLLGGVNHTTPRKSQWLSMSLANTTQCAGRVCHDILGRAWRRVWGKLEIPRAEADTDVLHVIVRSKTVRALKWLEQWTTKALSFMLSVVTLPVDHLWQKIHHLDAEGGTLKNIFSRDDPFQACRHAMGQFVSDTSASALGLFFAYYRDATRAEYTELGRCAFRGIMLLASLVWFHLEMFFHGWPYKAVLLADEDPLVRQSTAEELYAADKGDLTESFCLKLRGMAGSAAELLRKRCVRAGMRAWRDSAKIANMHTERLLSLIRTSAPGKCSAERVLSAGLLSQVRQVHRRCAGVDAGFRSSRRLRADGVPLRQKRRERTSAKAKWQRRFGIGELQRVFNFEWAEHVAAVRASGDLRRFRPRHEYKDICIYIYILGM